MAGQVIEVRVGDAVVLVETSRVAGTELTSRLGRAQEAVADAFEQAREAIEAVAMSTVEVIDRLGEKARSPEQVEVRFGLKFAASGGVIVAGVSGEAALEVKLTYRPEPRSAPTGS